MKTISKWIYLFLSSLCILSSGKTEACSRILVADNQNIVMVGRNMDWHEEMDTVLIGYPRRYSQYGDLSGTTSAHWLAWESTYASIVAAAYERLTTDGLNEAGLAVHILWLEDADFGVLSENKPRLSVTQWTQYYLDNFATVAEAICYTRDHPFDVAPFFHEGTALWGQMHLALDDATGDSAILEHLNGELKIYHDRNAVILTNEPPYEDHLSRLTHYHPFGGTLPVPESSDSLDRFVRGTYLAEHLPSFLPQEALLMEVLGMMQSIAQTSNTGERTLWHTVADLSNKIYYYQSTGNQRLLSVSFDDFDLNQSKPVLFAR